MVTIYCTCYKALKDTLICIYYWNNNVHQKSKPEYYIGYANIGKLREIK